MIKTNYTLMYPKFRAFYDGMMVYDAAKVGNALYWDGGKNFDAFAFKQATRAIMMQCIGFRDKHMTSIYTGDILTDGYGRILEVDWNVYRFRFNALTETNFKYSYQIGEWFEFSSDLPEIIGNIYENPELLRICQ